MRIPIRTSRWAIWASRAARLALPVLVIAVFMHRDRLIDSPTFLAAGRLGIGLGLIALIVGLNAYARIWFTGDRGWRPATIGVVTGLICLAPVVYAVVQGVRYPMLHDVSTDLLVPPALQGTSPIAPGFTPAIEAGIRAAFPNAAARDYPLSAGETFDLVAELVAARGWAILVEAPPGPGAPGTLNAVALTMLGWRDEVAIRIVDLGEGARLDMRSASYDGTHDLGANGLRIESLLLELDDAVTERTHELGLVAPGG
ncbi:MAG: DUF1499 domain-containing protein [Cucumibacter sp.]